MKKIEEARNILSSLGMPQLQQSDLCCYALLAMLNTKENTPWRSASNEWIRIHDIIVFLEEAYGVKYAENSRETFRKQAMHQFRDAALSEDNGKSTNSPNYRYRITEEALLLIRCYDSDKWDSQLKEFKKRHESLIEQYSSKKQVAKMPVKIDGIEYTLSSGAHNQLQKAIIEEFAPRFAPGCECLYLGDSTDRDLCKNDKKLAELGMQITKHDEMPDVVLYREDKHWLYFVEAVTSVGPMSPERVNNIRKMTEKVSAGLIFVTAFPDFKTFKKFSEQLAWETEVWISEMTDHMIHLNGDKFMGPR